MTPYQMKHVLESLNILMDNISQSTETAREASACILIEQAYETLKEDLEERKAKVLG